MQDNAGTGTHVHLERPLDMRMHPVPSNSSRRRTTRSQQIACGNALNDGRAGAQVFREYTVTAPRGQPPRVLDDGLINPDEGQFRKLAAGARSTDGIGSAASELRLLGS